MVFCGSRIRRAVIVTSVILFVDKALLTLDVLEHVLAFGQLDEIRKHLRVLLIEVAEFRKAHVTFVLAVVEPLHELIDVVEDQVVFEDAHHVSLLVVNQIVDHF